MSGQSDFPDINLAAVKSAITNATIDVGIRLKNPASPIIYSTIETLSWATYQLTFSLECAETTGYAIVNNDVYRSFLDWFTHNSCLWIYGYNLDVCYYLRDSFNAMFSSLYKDNYSNLGNGVFSINVPLMICIAHVLCFPDQSSFLTFYAMSSNDKAGYLARKLFNYNDLLWVIDMSFVVSTLANSQFQIINDELRSSGGFAVINRLIDDQTYSITSKNFSWNTIGCRVVSDVKLPRDNYTWFSYLCPPTIVNRTTALTTFAINIAPIKSASGYYLIAPLGSFGYLNDDNIACLTVTRTSPESCSTVRVASWNSLIFLGFVWYLTGRIEAICNDRAIRLSKDDPTFPSYIPIFSSRATIPGPERRFSSFMSSWSGFLDGLKQGSEYVHLRYLPDKTDSTFFSWVSQGATVRKVKFSQFADQNAGEMVSLCPGNVR